MALRPLNSMIRKHRYAFSRLMCGTHHARIILYRRHQMRQCTRYSWFIQMYVHHQRSLCCSMRAFRLITLTKARNKNISIPINFCGTNCYSLRGTLKITE